MSATKKYFACSECAKKTSTTNAKRIKAHLCAACAPDLDALPTAARTKQANVQPAKVKRTKAPKPGTPRPVTDPVMPCPDVESVAVPVPEPAVNLPVVATSIGESAALPGAVPLAPVSAAAELDQRIADAREAMNRLAADLSAAWIELAALRDQRRALGPAPRSRRDPDAPRRPTLLDAAARVLADTGGPMQAKAIWRAIVERGLWQSPNGGKTPFATLAAAIMRDVVAKGAESRFAKAGRGLFATQAS